MSSDLLFQDRCENIGRTETAAAKSVKRTMVQYFDLCDLF